MAARKIEINTKNMTSSSNVHHLPYIVLGSQGYLIDESSFKFKRQRHNKDDMIKRKKKKAAGTEKKEMGRPRRWPELRRRRWEGGDGGRN
ncbi:hypothetical protein P8452_53743 [Trifolium repens]|nr:hypothetical protein P8452_53743 [Trifolium repens]